MKERLQLGATATIKEHIGGIHHLLWKPKLYFEYLQATAGYVSGINETSGKILGTFDMEERML